MFNTMLCIRVSDIVDSSGSVSPRWFIHMYTRLLLIIQYFYAMLYDLSIVPLDVIEVQRMLRGTRRQCRRPNNNRRVWRLLLTVDIHVSLSSPCPPQPLLPSLWQQAHPCVSVPAEQCACA